MLWRLVRSLGYVVALIAVGGAFGSKFGIWEYGFGFQLLSTALFLGFLGLVASSIGIGLSLKRKTFELLLGLSVSAALCAVTFGYLAAQFWKIGEYPPIHDISTDLENPPQFQRVLEARGESSNSLAFKPKFAEYQREYYADIESWVAPWEMAEALRIAEQVLNDMGMEVVGPAESSDDQDDASEGHEQIEAIATTFWFGFKDDVVVRVKSKEGSNQETIVDLRSVSRIGVADLGKNAERVREVLSRLEKRATDS